MASDESETTAIQYSMQEEEFDYEMDDGSDHHLRDHQPHPHNLSRLSVCTSSTMCGLDDFDGDDVDNALKMYMSRLSIESFDGDGDGDADEELSDGKESAAAGLSSESENELGSCYSLPATPPRRRNRGGMGNPQLSGMKDYASENEAQKRKRKRKRKSDTRRRRSRITTDRWISDKPQTWESVGDCSQKAKKKEEDHGIGLNFFHSFSGESDQGSAGGSTGFMVITRPKGGRRSLCMDLEEVKACRDLGFELEHERMLEIPTRHSVSNSTLETSSGGNSPIANWRISSPGDDPRDVKARLKVWAQAVALASTSRQGN